MDLLRLVAMNKVDAGTLVWHEALSGWQPMGTAFAAAFGGAEAGVPQVSGLPLPREWKDLVVQQVREGDLTDAPRLIEYGGFGERWVALLIDGAVLAIPELGVRLLVKALMGAPALSVSQAWEDRISIFGEGRWQRLLALFSAGFCLHALYSIILVTLYGATLGKMAVGLKIVAENGSKISAARATGRYFAEYVSYLTLCIGHLMVIFDDQKRALHDHICSTRVIKNL